MLDMSGEIISQMFDMSGVKHVRCVIGQVCNLSGAVIFHVSDMSGVCYIRCVILGV